MSPSARASDDARAKERAAAAKTARDAEFLAVLESEHELLVRIAYSMLRNEDDVNDVLGDAVSKTYARWRRGRIDDLPHYLARAVKNTAIGRARKHRYQVRALEQLATEADTAQTADDAASPADVATLRARLDKLSDECRVIIDLRIYRQLPVKDVAAQLHIAEGTVKSRCSRCLKQLGRNLGVRDDRHS